MDILEALWAGEYQSPGQEERSTWKSSTRAPRRRRARNQFGQERSFSGDDAEQKAADFARGNIPGPPLGRPKPKKHPIRREKKQTYDYTPTVKKDMEGSS